MGVYLNPGKEAYQTALNSEIFVDKTCMLRKLNNLVNTNQKYVSVSRPRRFGKSMAADMICAYYDREAGSREMFSALKLADDGDDYIAKTENKRRLWDAYLGAFDVIRVVMSDFINRNRTVDEGLRLLTKRIIDELEEKYPDIKYDRFNDENLLQTIDDVYSEINRQAIIVIDEWDAVFRVRKDDAEGQTEYLDFLRDLLKDNSKIALAYMTGILPIKKYGEHSALNMFTEYSMMAPMQFAEFTGFEEDEVRELCRNYGRDYDRIREWYDGYNVSDIIPPDPNHEMLKEKGVSPSAKRYALYSPLSVVNAVTTGYIKNYWNKTETYEALAEYIRMDYDGLKDAVALLMDGGRLKIDTSTYQNDMTTFNGRDDVFSLLIHLGYLGYLGYDDENGEVFIPNREILDEFRASTKSGEWVSAFKSYELSQEILCATWEENADRVAELLEKAHDYAGNMTYNDEAALSYGIQLAYYAAQKYYTIIPEFDSGKGYADVVYIPSPKYSDKPVLLVELKYNKDADTAIAQIKRREYPARLEHYKGNILLVGIDYDKEARSDSPDFKHHRCKIEHA